MRNAGLEKLIWVLIYGGLLALCLGLFVARQDGTLGGWLIGGGAVTAIVGAALIAVRARRGPDN